MHRRCIDEQVLNREFRKLPRKELFGDALPEPRCFQNVGLVHRRDPALALLCELTRNSQYPLDLRAGVGADVGRAVFTALFLTEIDTSGQFTYDDDVDADQQFFFYR